RLGGRLGGRFAVDRGGGGLHALLRGDVLALGRAGVDHGRRCADGSGPDPQEDRERDREQAGDHGQHPRSMSVTVLVLLSTVRGVECGAVLLVRGLVGGGDSIRGQYARRSFVDGLGWLRVFLALLGVGTCTVNGVVIRCQRAHGGGDPLAVRVQG